MTQPRESPRSRRVADRIQVEIAELLEREVRDPRLAKLTITSVAVTRDLGSAKIWVVSPVGQTDEKPVLEALKHAAPYLRTLLAPRLGLRTVPTLTFFMDRSLEAGDRIERLLREIRDAEPPSE